MAIYYVDKALGTNGASPQGESPGAGAWATIQFAVDNTADTDVINVEGGQSYAETITFNADDASKSRTFQSRTADVTVNPGSRCIFVDGGIARGSLAYSLFKGFIFAPTASTQVTRLRSEQTLAFEDCTFTPFGASDQIVNGTGSDAIYSLSLLPSRDVTFKNCTFGNCGSIVNATWFHDICLEDCTFGVVAGDMILLTLGEPNKIKITNATYAGTGTVGGLISFTSGSEYAIEEVFLQNIIGTNQRFGLNIERVTKRVFIDNVDLTINTASDPIWGIYVGANQPALWGVGVEYVAGNQIWNRSHLFLATTTVAAGTHEPFNSSDWEDFWVLADIGGVTVNRCKVTFASTGFAHNFLIGRGCIGARFTNNRGDSKEFGFVDKAWGTEAFGNVMTGKDTYYIRGGVNLAFHNNTAKCNSGVALRFAINSPDRVSPLFGEYHSNILDASSGGTFALSDVSDAEPEGGDVPATNYDSFFDYNCYFGGSTALALMDTANKADIAAVRTKWALPWGPFPGNDINSLQEDPLLDADFKPQNPNVKTGGKPDVNGNKTSMGAVTAAQLVDTLRCRVGFN